MAAGSARVTRLVLLRVLLSEAVVDWTDCNWSRSAAWLYSSLQLLKCRQNNCNIAEKLGSGEFIYLVARNENFLADDS